MEYALPEFEALYIQCFSPAMRLAVSILHDEEDARDVVQDVFIKLWETNSRPEHPLTYIIRAVRNTCLNRVSALSTREKFYNKISLETYNDDVDLEEHYQDIVTAISQLLTPRERQVMDKIYSDGLSYKEAAAGLDISVASINKYLVSALKKLRKHFQNR